VNLAPVAPVRLEEQAGRDAGRLHWTRQHGGRNGRQSVGGRSRVAPAKADILVARGARLAKTPADAAQGEIVVTMLADDQAIEQVVFGEHGILEGLHLVRFISR
jgi:3-hydroxyisobutyrate dehydrogenase-like beta-hydroxyacid dehydrogenase